MNKKKKEDKIRTDAEKLITELYQNDKNGKLDKPLRLPWAKLIIMIFIFGFFGGMAGEMVMNEYFPRDYISTDIDMSLFSKKKDTQNQENMMLEEIQREKVVNELKFGFIEIYEKKKSGEKAPLYFSPERLGQGMILTSDGWILTKADTIAKYKKESLAVSFAQDIYDVKELVNDPLTGGIFMKIEASNLPVSQFAEADGLKEGQEVLVFENKDSVISSKIKSLNYIDPEKGTIRSSEDLLKLILLQDKLKTVSAGAPVVDLEGEIIGIALNGESLATAVLPMDYVKGAIKNVLKGEAIARPYLGVNYIDLAYVSGYGSQKKGALLSGDGKKMLAVEKGSPAEDADLRQGDIIIKVKSEDVDQKHSLTQLIQDYKAGDAVDITFLRDGVEYKVNAELGKVEEVKKSAEVEDGDEEV